MKFVSWQDKLILGICAIILIAGTPLLFSDLEYFEAKGTIKIGSVKTLQNKVRRKISNQYQYSDLKTGKSLYLDDTVFVGPDSSAVLYLENKDLEIKLSENSLIQLSEKDGELKLELRSGRAQVVSEGKMLDIKTPKNFIIKKRPKAEDQQTEATELVAVEDNETLPVIITEVEEPVATPTLEPEPVAQVVEPEVKKQVIELAPFQLQARYVKALRAERQQGKKSFVEIMITGIPANSQGQPIEIMASKDSEFKTGKKYVFEGQPLRIETAIRKGRIFLKANYQIDSQRDPASEYRRPQDIKQTITFEDVKSLREPAAVFPKQNQTQFFRDEKTSQMIFSWKGDNEAMAYNLEISKDEEFSTAENFHTKEAKILVKRPLQTGTYYWRVRSYNQYVDSPWSQVRSFSVYRAISK